MMMGTGSTTTVAMPSTSASGSMATDTGSSAMDMSSSESTMDMSMNTALTTSYTGYPVIFSTLSAANGAAAFGIFCVLFFTAFAFRGLAFLGAYVEQRVFTGGVTSLKEDDETTTGDDDEEEAPCCGPPKERSEDLSSLKMIEHDSTTQRSTVARFFHFTPQSLYRDFIRLLITFVSTMIGYALMLSVMSFILPYLFAVVLGVSFGDIFFLRLSNAMGIRPAGTFCATIH